MHTTHQFFLTKRSLYILVLDARQNELENRLEYWLKIINSFGGDSPVIVVCNKTDQNDLELNWKRIKEKYYTVKNFASNVSCKTGMGIEQLRDIIKAEVSQLEHIHDELRLSWFEVKNHLEKMESNYISYSQYRQLCKKEGITDEPSQRTLVGFLHDLGVILHFHDHPILEDTNVLNPEWVTQGVYAILNCHKLFQKKGRLEIEELKTILDPQIYPSERHFFIIEMMRKFELCFDFEGQINKRLLIPDLLSREEPDTGEWNSSLVFQFHYNVLPSSIISRFIVRIHPYISQNTFWRYGVVVTSEDKQNKALVRADIEDKTISIYIKGRKDSRRSLLDIIRSDFHRIHKTVPRLEVREKIPIPGKPILVDYDHLLTLIELGEHTFVPEGLREKVVVRHIFENIGVQPTYDVPKGKNGVERLSESEEEAPRLSTPKDSQKKKSSLTLGLFFFFVAITIMTLVAALSRYVSWYALPIVVLAGLLTPMFIGLLQALDAGTLSEKGFIQVFIRSYKQLALLVNGGSSKDSPDD